MLPKKLSKKLEKRKADNAFRQLGNSKDLVDFSSNDYLGFSKSQVIFGKAHQYLIENKLEQNGSTGSRLLSGNHSIYSDLEAQIAKLHLSESALLFNSGYDANLGVISSIAQRGDIILYDELAHASIRDGITMSNAKSYKFKHNNLKDLEQKCQTERSRNPKNTEIYIVTESVFSMDGDSPNVEALISLCETYNVHLIIDEAHALGVFGFGLVHHPVFARIITFGKAMGCHGAAILGSKHLTEYLINFSRPFIYTTALPPHALASVKMAYEELVIQSSSTAHSINSSEESQVENLKNNITFFNSEVNRLNLQNAFIKSESAIHCCVIPENNRVKYVAQQLQDIGFNVKPILSPTVPKGKERLRFCLHSYNSKEEISEVLNALANFVN